MIERFKIILKDIKFEHTVFSLPFALMSAFLAAEGIPPLNKLFWIVTAIVGARSCAMAFNRIVDVVYDGSNPRTSNRALPSGKVKLHHYLIFLLVSALLFLFSCYMLNTMAFQLSLPALIIIFFYSFTKRFTSNSHLFLGLALSLAPIGAWVAVREEISLTSIVLGTTVLLWLAGFDIIYACQDINFDKRNGLFSIPRRYGITKALRISSIFHILMIISVLSLIMIDKLGFLYLTGVALVALLLWYEHSIVKPADLSRVNVAFFNVNGVISIMLMLFVIIDCVWI